jgi:DNA-binding response OmpR family regulator
VKVPVRQLGNSRSKTVAVVDDSLLALEVARAALEGAGFDVVTANTLTELENLLASHKPDLFLVDVSMPEMFGDEVATVLRAVRKVNAPIWLFSDRPEPELGLRVNRAGIEGYIAKRDGVTEMVRRVRTILRP